MEKRFYNLGVSLPASLGKALGVNPNTSENPVGNEPYGFICRQDGEGQLFPVNYLLNQCI